MSAFDDEKLAQVAGARDDATSTEPIMLGQAAPPAATPAQRKDPRIKPHPTTRASWEELLKLRRTRAPAKRKVVLQVIEIVLHTRTGQRLVDDLHRVLFGKGKLVSHLVVDFRKRTDIPTSADAAGFFDPGYRYAPKYTVYTGWNDNLRSPGDIGSTPDGIFVDITSGLVSMAATLFHELLHVWFIHQYRDLGPDDHPSTGHSILQVGTNSYDWIHPEFLRRLRAMLAELEAIEAYLFPHQTFNVPRP